MIQPFPRPINPKVKKQSDDQLAKVGQLNQLVRDVNQLQTNPSTSTGIPFEWYPPAGLTNDGPKFTYTDGVQLISYHIKGITPISSGGNGFEQYLCSVNFPEGSPFLFPGSITGMFQSGGGGDIVTTPLANGGLVELDGIHVPVSNFVVNLFDYGNNPQEDGSYNYALVVDATVENPDALTITGLMSYDFEFLLPNFIQSPTIFQD
jgi:hypothetical protein